MSRPTLSALKAFEAIIRTGSLRAASQELCITQSAVSHQLKRLEDSMGLSLVVRRGRGIEPTAEGKRLAEGLKEGFQRLDAAVDGILADTSGRRLCICCLPSVAVRWLIPHLKDFRLRHPDISISIQYSDYLYSPIGTDADVLISWLDGAPPDNSCSEKLFSGATYPVASPIYLDRVGLVREPVDLLKMELLHDHSILPWQEWFRSQGIIPGVLSEGAVYEDFNLLSAAAITGQGVALCPVRLIDTELKQGTLKQLFDVPVNEERAYWLFHHPKPSSSVLAFCNWLGNVIAVDKDMC
jgi:LysR family glycine cleavage system transcriptional activator